MENFTSLAEVDRIAAMTEPVLRNFQISQSYHELSLALSKRTGPCVNWCTIATWASMQAGQTIRRQDLASALETHVKTSPELSLAISGMVEMAMLKGAGVSKEGMAKLIWETIDLKGAMDRASAAVARGNQKVYAEIAREFARFLEACERENAGQTGALEAFYATLKPGDPPDGQRYLGQAFSHYHRAFFETDNKTRAELIFLANLEIGFHEQTRLQPEIAEALEASVTDPLQFKRNLLKALFPRQSWMAWIGDWFRELTGRPTPLERATQHFAGLAKQHLRKALTAHLMELRFPGGRRLKLGDDLKTGFPTVLATLLHPDFTGLMPQIDPTPDSLRETGAIDWANLPDRLHFIADLFRCEHEASDLLLTPPFKIQILQTIRAGQIPAGFFHDH